MMQASGDMDSLEHALLPQMVAPALSIVMIVQYSSVLRCLFVQHKELLGVELDLLSLPQ